MPLQQPLHLRQIRPAVDPVDDLPIDHEHQRRHLLDAELGEQARVLVGVHAPHLQARALLACDVCEQAFHPARRT